MINFNSWKENIFRTYNGANGKKKCLVFNNEPYMVKIMDTAQIGTKPMGAISEYLGCHIYDLLGIPVQDTVLGKYTNPKTNEIFWAVACKDFCGINDKLLDFSTVRNSIVFSSKEGNTKELEPILISIEEQNMVPINNLKKRFWDMFIIDALIGNFDRHTGNFGLIVNEAQQIIKLAPVYDCGSSLYPSPTDEQICEILQNEQAKLARVYEFPASCYLDKNNQKYKYHELISSNRYSDCTKSLFQLKPRIDSTISEINTLIDSIEGISNIRKIFYKTMISLRKERIIDYAYEKINSKIQATVLETAVIMNEAHKREQYIATIKPMDNSIISEYIRLYQHIIQLSIFQVQTEQTHLRNSDIDAIIVSALKKEKRFSDDAIINVCEQYSPAAVGKKNYGKRILIKSKLPSFKSYSTSFILNMNSNLSKVDNNNCSR